MARTAHCVHSDSRQSPCPSGHISGPCVKTAVLSYFSIEERQECDLETVNRLRVEELELSPIAQLTEGEGISKALDLIFGISA